jgi:general secretion pathway protein G
MIELIFVIVIIGILAAVALPKLAATRDDAKISSLVANTKTVVNDAKNYYTAKGEKIWVNSTNVPDFTDVPLFTDTSCNTQATATTDAQKTFYMCSDNGDVVKIDVNNTHIKVSNGSDTSSVVARGVQSDPAFKALVATSGIRLGGSTVVR